MQYPIQGSLSSYCMPLPSCQVCFDEGYLTYLPCRCYFCANCLSDWMVTQIQELQFQEKGTVVCLLEGCKKTFDPSVMLPDLNHDQRLRVTDALTRSYLVKTDDIRLCPNSKCTYAGVISLKEKCKSTLECELCDKKWREKVHYSFLEDIINPLLSYELPNSNFMSDIWEEVFTNQCPKCSISIIKNGGCPHMTCKKCGYEFCWHCLHDYKGHNKNLCFSAMLGKMMITTFMVFSIAALSGLTTLFKMMFGTFAIFIFKLVLYDAVLVFIGGVGFWSYWIFKGNKSNRTKIFAVLGIVITFVCAYWFWDSVYTAIMYYLGQGFVALILRIHTKVTYKWLLAVY